MGPFTEEELLESLRELTLCQNWEDIRHTFRAHPELLSRESIDTFRRVIEELEQHGHFDSARAFRFYYDILLQARQVGIEEVIADASGEKARISPELQTILGELSGPEPAPNDMAERILLIQHALRLTSPDQTPKVWAALHGMLGDSLLKKPDRDRGENIEHALKAYQEASLRTPKVTEPIMSAINSNSLAKAYLQRMHGRRAENLDHAVTAFRDALGLLTGQMGAQFLAEDSEKTLTELSMGTPQELERAVDNLQNILHFLNDLATEEGGTVDRTRLDLLLMKHAATERAGGLRRLRPARAARRLSPWTRFRPHS